MNPQENKPKKEREREREKKMERSEPKKERTLGQQASAEKGKLTPKQTPKRAENDKQAIETQNKSALLKIVKLAELPKSRTHGHQNNISPKGQSLLPGSTEETHKQNVVNQNVLRNSS